MMLLACQVVGTEVLVLTEPLEVADFRAYGRPAAAATLPAGTIVVSMAQANKHYIQAMMHEGTYVAFPYFYDLTGWSAPLLENVPGGYSGLELESKMQATRLQPQQWAIHELQLASGQMRQPVALVSQNIV
eukprot:SAG31_NODE_18974_length_616_cov_0.845261_1_plen_131_part_00